MRRVLVLILAAAAVAALAAGAGAAPAVSYGLQDDAWIEFGPGTLESRIATLQELGLKVVRVTVHWDAAEPSPGEYDWSRTDALLEPLEAAGIDPVVTLYGTPEWANGGRDVNVAPNHGADFAAFAAAIADRYPRVRRWTIWNEPNQRRWLSTASPAQYVTRLLNPAYIAIHEASPSSKVAGGVTAPRGGAGGTSPVAFIRGMARAGARLDAYAHHPYALAPGETPWSGGCMHCQTITMATIGRLATETQKAFGRPVRLWLTELGYQSNPPDRILGVPPLVQAEYIAAAAYRAWATPRVDLLVQYLFRDEPGVDRWQSGLETTAGRTKPALAAVAAPLAQVSRRGDQTALWGTIRPGSGPRSYRLQRWANGVWSPVGAVGRTGPNGVLQRELVAGPGTRLRLVSGGVTGNVLVVR
jgi:glycosyl hydrolase family 42 (putative beta-galactosidase)